MDKIFEILRPSFEGSWNYIKYMVSNLKDNKDFIIFGSFIGALILIYLFSMLMIEFFIKIGVWWRDFKELVIRDSHKTLGR